MREIIIPMPRIPRTLSRCSLCGDELTPNLKVCMMGSYDAKRHTFSAEYAHPQCAARRGIIRDDHVVPAEKVLPLWKRMARLAAGAGK